MKRFVSVSLMANMPRCRSAFTLIEVMLSVLIITLVIAALYSMRANSSFLMQQTVQKNHVQNAQSFLLGNYDYGFIKESVTLDKLLEGFDVEDTLRRRLKNEKLLIDYMPTDSIDSNATNLELGKNILKNDLASTSFLRLQAL